jgi:hypothetical protein
MPSLSQRSAQMLKTLVRFFEDLFAESETQKQAIPVRVEPKKKPFGHR